MFVKKRGFLLVEVIVILNICILLLMLFSKQIHINIEKMNHYGVKDNILSLSKEEELFLIELDTILFRGCEGSECVGCLQDEYIEYLYSENSSISVEMDGDNIFLVNKNKSIRKLKLIKALDEKCMLIPTEYFKIENR